jgi:hypothetical protein
MSYTVTSSPGGRTVTAGGSPVQVTGLTNAVGDSQASPASNAVTPSAALAPANDNFASAQVITGDGGTVTGTNVNATTETGEPGIGGASVWYVWTVTHGGLVQIDTCGSSFTPIVAAYTGSAVNALTSLGSSTVPVFLRGHGHVDRRHPGQSAAERRHHLDRGGRWQYSRWPGNGQLQSPLGRRRVDRPSGRRRAHGGDARAACSACSLRGTTFGDTAVACRRLRPQRQRLCLQRGTQRAGDRAGQGARHVAVRSTLSSAAFTSRHTPNVPLYWLRSFLGSCIGADRRSVFRPLVRADRCSLGTVR